METDTKSSVSLYEGLDLRVLIIRSETTDSITTLVVEQVFNQVGGDGLEEVTLWVQGAFAWET